MLDVRKSILPLRLIFWGALLCIIDITFTITTNGQGFQLDIFDDTVGTILIAFGVSRLASMQVHRKYTSVMRFVQTIAILSILDSIRAHFVTPLPNELIIIINLFQIIMLAAIISFIIAMRWFCDKAGLVMSSRSWRTSKFLFIWIYLFPLGIWYLISIVATAISKPFSIDLGLAWPFLLPVLFLLFVILLIPFIHLFITTSRMMREARKASQDL